MDAVLNWLIAHPAIIAAFATNFLASTLCALTRTPDPNTRWGKIYVVLEILAGNILNAKDSGRGKSSLLAVLLVVAVASGICMTPACSTIAPSPGTSSGMTEAVTGSYNVLKTAGLTYDASMKTMAVLYKKRLISDETKARTIDIANGFWSAYNEAVDALEVYQTTRLAADETKAQAAIGAMLARLAEMQMYIQPVIGGE